MNSLFPTYPILIVDDELSALKSFEVNLLTGGTTNIVSFQDSRKVLPFIADKKIELILLDLTMPHVSGIEILKSVSRDYPEIPVIVVTGLNDVNTAVECMKFGAVDYLLKPVERNRLTSAVKRVIELRELKLQYGLLKKHLLGEGMQNPSAFSHIITNNRKIKSLFQYIEAVSKTSEPILITGETGVGKELFARAIHNVSQPGGKFIAVNVAGLDDNMFTDTLFGHKKGAFTDAFSIRTGLVEQADRGTLFLDEVGDLTSTSQVKLLRLVQEREFYPLGSDVPKYTNTRLVIATNRNLSKLMKDSNFRKDLYYRLSVHNIDIPPLKERKDDIPLLVSHFFKEASEAMGKKEPTPPKELFSLLELYNFPGNVRELRSMIYEAVSQHKSRVLSLEIFKKAIGLEDVKKPKILEEEDEIETNVFSNIEKLPGLKKAENMLIIEAMRRTKGNQSIAAKLLGITRQALNSRLKNKGVSE